MFRIAAILALLAALALLLAVSTATISGNTGAARATYGAAEFHQQLTAIAKDK